jgi:NAD(P)-dependent dehydrogenase (short-subunit alcohol dehydrogenase family)
MRLKPEAPLTRCWALDLAPDRVNAVAAGPTKTDFLTEQMNPSVEQAEAVTAEECSRIPLGRRGVPEDVATWIGLLVSLSGAWITAQVFTVNGGFNIT